MPNIANVQGHSDESYPTIPFRMQKLRCDSNYNPLCGSASLVSQLLLFLQLFCLTSSLNNEDIARWDQEIDVSLANNFRSCPITHQSGEKIDLGRISSAESLFIQRIYPRRHEATAFQALPPTLSKANRNYMKELSKKNYTYPIWGAETFLKWQIPKNHPGQNRSNCLHVTELATKADPVHYAFYEEYKVIDRAFYIATIGQAYIHPAGIILTSCGEYYGEESCGNRFLDLTQKRLSECRTYLRSYHTDWNRFFSNGSLLRFDQRFDKKCSVTKVTGTKVQEASVENEVFVINALWDRTYFHFLVDSLARLAHHYDYLLQHPEIKLHLAFEEDYSLRSATARRRAKRMRHQILELLGFNLSRVISGPVFTKKLYLPRTLRCGNAISNPIEVRLIANYLLQATRSFLKHYYPVLSPAFQSVWGKRFRRIKPPSSTLSSIELSQASFLSQLSSHFLNRSSIRWPPAIPVEFIEKHKLRSKHLIIMQRYPTDPDPGPREWSDEQFTALIYALARAYPDHNIIPISSLKQDQADYCLACDIFLYSQVDVLVGAHGSGFSNAMFLAPHGLMVEIVDDVNDLHMPICGYHGVYAGIFGLHHYMFAYYLPGGETIDGYVEEIANDSSRFYGFLQRFQSKQLLPNERIEIHWNSTGSSSFRP